VDFSLVNHTLQDDFIIRNVVLVQAFWKLSGVLKQWNNHSFIRLATQVHRSTDFKCKSVKCIVFCCILLIYASLSHHTNIQNMLTSVLPIWRVINKSLYMLIVKERRSKDDMEQKCFVVFTFNIHATLSHHTDIYLMLTVYCQFEEWSIHLYTLSKKSVARMMWRRPGALIPVVKLSCVNCCLVYMCDWGPILTWPVPSWNRMDPVQSLRRFQHLVVNGLTRLD